jgi:hypothetical protein
MMPAGLFDPAVGDLFREATAALIEFTPEHLKMIHCTVRPVMERGQPGLAYEISCPDFPDQGTTRVNARVHEAMTRLAQYLSSIGRFTGAEITVQQQPDGSWRNNVRLLDAAPPGGTEDAPAAPPRPSQPWWKFWPRN